MTEFVLTFLAVSLLAAVHLFSHQISKFENSARFHLFISFAAGTSIAYVALHLMPHLAAESGEVSDTIAGLFGQHDIAVYAVVLAGILMFFGVRTLGVTPNHEQQEARAVALSTAFIFSISMFAIVNISMGHVIHARVALGYEILLLYVMAIGFHYLVIDFNLRRKHGDAYVRYARWLLVAAIVVGWLLGYVVNMSRGGFVALLAFIVGGVILNTLNTQLPDQSRKSYLFFITGAVSYGMVIILVQ